MKLILEIKFAGGLGNQLFQYAAARRLCLINKIPFLLLNTGNYKNESLGRTFSLSGFNIKGYVIRNETVAKIFRRHTKLNDIATFLLLHKHIDEPGFKLHQLENKTGFLNSLSGFWQSSFYFNDIRETLLKELIPLKIPSSPKWLGLPDTVAVHIRRTDYLTENRYGFLGIEYYKDAMAIIKDKLAKPVFILFSDDIEWCKLFFKETDIIFCEEKDWSPDFLAIYLMSKCRHQVIANSSFSWWGAWLNTNPDKIVIRPGTPFKEKSLLYEAHYPGEWLAVKNN